jgi:hypothetical protein
MTVAFFASVMSFSMLKPMVSFTSQAKASSNTIHTLWSEFIPGIAHAINCYLDVKVVPEFLDAELMICITFSDMLGLML